LGLPFSFLAGVLVLALHEEFDVSLPGESSWTGLVPWLPLLFVPWLLSFSALWWVRREALDHRAVSKWLVMLLRLQSLAIPGCYGLLVFCGALPQVAASALPDSHVVQIGALCGPLLFMELSMRWAEGSGRRWLEYAGVFPPSPLRVSMTLFVATPILMLMVAGDLLALNRSAWVFFNQTAVGNTLGLLALVALLCFVLPPLFCWIMPVTRELPLDVGADLRSTAERLGFTGRSVLLLETGFRVINAAMVGPMRWPRFLVLTDGLLAFLDPLALRGVVAHEVGHAKANHPALLVMIFAGLPLLLLHPVVLWELFEIDGPSETAGVVVFVAVAVVFFRKLAHRFEYEADQLSAEGLGGASYCVQALRRVGELAPRAAHRASFRHPSERKRILHLYACERDAQYRARFWWRGKAIRRALFAVVVVAVSISVWAHVSTWPIDRAVYSFYNGRFAESGQRLDQVRGTLPQSQQMIADRLRDEVDAALDLGFTSVRWDDAREQLAAKARARVEVLVAAATDTEGLLPWLSLALYGTEAEPWLQSLYLYCASPGESDAELARIRQYILGLEDAPAAVKSLLRKLG